jgi:PAS domain S-box-containing protein
VIFIWRLVSLLLLGLSAVSVTAQDGATRRVLLIHSFGRDFAPFNLMASHFRTELGKLYPERVEFVDASLEMARFDGVEKDEPLLTFLAAVFAQKPPDLLVPIGAPAALFCHRNRASLFPKVPILAVGLDKRRADPMADTPGVVEAMTDIELGVLMENILRVRPETRQVFVTMGTAPLEQFWAAELKKAWEPYGDRVEIHFLDGLSLGQMKPVLASLPKDGAIFHGIMNRDAAGVTHEAENALAELKAVANAPSFGYSDAQLGMGIIGGRLLPLRESAQRAATAAVRLLDGEDPSAIQLDPVPLSAPVYDWRELRRWGIKDSSLPAGSTVRFRVPTLWQTHRGWIVGAGVVAGLQTGLIVMLLAARRRARESDAAFSLAAESVGLGVWQRDMVTNEITASEQWRLLFGLNAAEPLTLQRVMERVPAEEREDLQRAIELGNKQGQRYLVEHQVLTGDGSTRWIASMARAEAGNGAGVVRTRGVSMDITERKRMEAELGQQRDQFAHLARVASLGELTGSLAHELNQPLGAILSNAQTGLHLLDRPVADLAELREILGDIVEADKRAGEVIVRVRSLLQSGEAKRVAVHLESCVEEVERLMRTDLLERGVDLQTAFAPDLPAVLGDSIQLQQVMINLLMNACDAMAETPPAERIISVTSTAGENEVRISIEDRGIGLPEDLEQIFKPFHTTKKTGLGIGLAICRTIVESHRGRLWATRKETGPGAIFNLSLPAVRPPIA